MVDCSVEPWLSALSALSALSGRCRGAVRALSVALSYDSYYNTVGSVGQLSRHCRALSEHQDSTHAPALSATVGALSALSALSTVGALYISLSELSTSYYFVTFRCRATVGLGPQGLKAPKASGP